MIANAFAFILNTIFGLFIFSVLLRFYLQLTGAPFKNPLSQSIVAITNWAVIPTRRIVPSMAGLDLSTLILALAFELILQILLRVLGDYPLMVAGQSVWVSLIGLSIVHLLELSVYIFLYASIAQALLSWIAPYNLATPVLDALTRPILKPIRNMLPMPNGMDFSPIVLFIIAELTLMLVITPLQMFFMHAF